MSCVLMSRSRALACIMRVSCPTLDKLGIPRKLPVLVPVTQTYAAYTSTAVPSSRWQWAPHVYVWRFGQRVGGSSLAQRSFAAQAGAGVPSGLTTWQGDLATSLQLMLEGSPDAARELLEKGISSVEKELGSTNHPLVAVMFNQAAVVYLIGSMYEDAEKAAREALRIIQNFAVPTSIEVAACQLRLAAVLVAREQASEAKRLLAACTPTLSQSPEHQDSLGEAMYYTGLAQLLSAHSYDAVRRVDDLMVEGLRKFGERIDLQRPLVDVALREHALLRKRAEQRGEWEVVEALLQQALLQGKAVGVDLQLRGMLALQLGVVQYQHRGKTEAARETFAAALEALGTEMEEGADVVQLGLKRYEMLRELLQRYSAAPET